MVGKLSASGRQNTLAAALQERGALRRTIYAVRYLFDPGVPAHDLPATT
ncbi:transposase [Pseudonocardia sp. HH130630-07]|nr:transposase [Pseudonocardia sp. HH130630-07]